MPRRLQTRFLGTLVAGRSSGLRAGALLKRPRTASLADITAVLDSEAPDPKRIADLRAKAAATPGTLGKGELARFFHARSQTKLALGDYRGAIADCEQAVEAAKAGLPHVEYVPILQSLALQYGYMGELKQSLDVWLRMAREVDRQGTRGRLFNANRNISQLYIAFGDLKLAQAYADRNSALIGEAMTWVNGTSANKAWWQGDVERGRAGLCSTRADSTSRSEQAMQRAEVFLRAGRAGRSFRFDRCKDCARPGCACAGLCDCPAWPYQGQAGQDGGRRGRHPQSLAQPVACDGQVQSADREIHRFPGGIEGRTGTTGRGREAHSRTA